MTEKRPRGDGSVYLDRLLGASDGDRHLVLCLGNLEPKKDVLTATFAHRLLAPELRRAHPLVIVGHALAADYAREIVTAPSSSGCRNTSSTLR